MVKFMDTLKFLSGSNTRKRRGSFISLPSTASNKKKKRKTSHDSQQQQQQQFHQHDQHHHQHEHDHHHHHHHLEGSSSSGQCYDYTMSGSFTAATACSDMDLSSAFFTSEQSCHLKALNQDRTKALLGLAYEQAAVSRRFQGSNLPS